MENFLDGDDNGNLVRAERVERSPVTKRPQLPTPNRKPSGPRHAFKPLQNIIQHVQDGNVIGTDASWGADVRPSELCDTGIEPSCLDALDDQLRASPIDSFMDVCWADAVGDHDRLLGTDSPTLYNAMIYTWPKMFDNYQDLDPLASDNEKWYEDLDESGIDTVENMQEPQKLQDTHSATHSQPSLAYWEPLFRIPNPNDTVHGFPSRPPKSRRRRKIDLLANACSRFHGRLVRSAT